MFTDRNTAIFYHDFGLTFGDEFIKQKFYIDQSKKDIFRVACTIARYLCNLDKIDCH